VSINFRLPVGEEKHVCELTEVGLFKGNEISLVLDEGAVFSQHAKPQVSKKIEVLHE